MIICHSRRFVFVHVHKTAGESISQALAGSLGYGDVIVGTTMRGRAASLIYPRLTSLHKHSSALAVRGRLTDDVWRSYFTFAFVRHPIDRMQSLHAYCGKMLRMRREPSLRNGLYALPGWRARDPLAWPEARAYRETASFSEFIRHPDVRERSPGARAQWISLCDGEGRQLVDFVGRYEALEADFAHVAAKIGLKGLALPRRNASRAAHEPISPEDEAYLRDVFRKDFELFGYDVAAAIPA